MKIKNVGLSFLLMLLLFALAGCSSGNAEGSTKNNKELIIADWGGPYSEAKVKAAVEPFEEKHGIKVTVITPPDYGKLKAMVESGHVEWDVVSVDNDYAIRAGNLGLLEKVDFDVIQTDGLYEELVHDYGVPHDIYSTLIAFNTDSFPTGDHPKNWADFWDTEKFPGPRALYKEPKWTLEAALLADGVEPENLYPLDIDRAFAKLDEIKGDIKVWWTAGAQPPELLATDEVPISVAWSGRITEAREDGAPVDLEFNQGIIATNTWVVPKGSPNKELAMEFIAFALEAEQQAAFSSNYDNAPANVDALSLLDEETVSRLGQTEDKQGQQVFTDDNWWVENFDEVNERFQQWLLE